MRHTRPDVNPMLPEKNRLPTPHDTTKLAHSLSEGD